MAGSFRRAPETGPAANDPGCVQPTVNTVATPPPTEIFGPRGASWRHLPPSGGACHFVDVDDSPRRSSRTGDPMRTVVQSRNEPERRGMSGRWGYGFEGVVNEGQMVVLGDCRGQVRGRFHPDGCWSCGACGREARECGQGGGPRVSVVHGLAHASRRARAGPRRGLVHNSTGLPRGAAQGVATRRDPIRAPAFGTARRARPGPPGRRRGRFAHGRARRAPRSSLRA